MSSQQGRTSALKNLCLPAQNLHKFNQLTCYHGTGGAHEPHDKLKSYGQLVASDRGQTSFL